MHLQALDIIVIVIFFLITFAIAAYYSRKAGKDTGQFFLSGRNLPWYIAGTAMVATTFAADTPLAVTELIAQNGIAGNWLWWNMAIGGMLTVFFFARLWRRAEIVTDLEFVEMRYSGKAAAILRGFRAIYLGIFMNAIVMGWVHKAMEKIFLVTFPGIDPFLIVMVVALVISIYASASGLLGTSRTDSFQFIFAMAGCIILAYIVIKLPEIGSTMELKNKLPAGTLSFIPKIQDISASGIASGVFSLSLGAFIAYVGLQWWSSWYPGADPGGGGYIAQRMMSAKDEKHSLFATLWFSIAHYAVRPWPWILVALASLVLLPRAKDVNTLQEENAYFYEQAVILKEKHQLEQKELMTNDEFLAYYEKYENTVDPGIMYPKLIIRYLPHGIIGLLIAVFLAAYMSTISSQLNWGTSYIINDFYKRFIKSGASEKHYVGVSRLSMFVMLLFSLIITRFFLTSVSGAWVFIINASAGMGVVLILRWYWWRINAWSEISALLAPLIIYPVTVYGFGIEPPLSLYPTVIGTTVCWITVTLLTKPVKEDVLSRYYKKVHPGGIGWKKLAALHPEVKADKGYGRLFLSWGLGVLLIYSSLFATGKFIFGEHLQGLIFSALAIISGIIIWNITKKQV